MGARDPVRRLFQAALCVAGVGLAAAVGCRRGVEVFPVEKVTVRSVNATSPGGVVPPSSDVEGALRRALERHGGFRWAAGREEEAVRVEADVVYRDPLGEADVPVNGLKVGVVLALRSGDERFEAEAWSAQDLGGALKDAVASGHLRLAARTLSDRALIKDAGAEGARGDAAVSELVRRKNPEAEAFLVRRLRGEDELDVRRAIGGLVELRRPSSVPALIESAQDRDSGFLRELIFALGVIGGDEARAYLFTLAQGHDQAPIREAAQQALDEMRDPPARSSSPNPESRR